MIDNTKPELTAEEKAALEAFERGEVKIFSPESELLHQSGLIEAVDIADDGLTAKGRTYLAAVANEAGEAKGAIVCLCGSTRFSQAFQDANFNETLAGRIVLTIGCDMKSDNELFKNMSEAELTDVKTRLDALHFAKIKLADEVLILNVGGYIGQSTRRELEYAKSLGKAIRYLEPVAEVESKS